MKILLVEDELDLLNLLTRFLKKEGYVCEQAQSLKEGYKKINVATLLIWLLMPEELRWQILAIFLFCISLLYFSFHFITTQRINRIRHQLEQIIQTLERFDIDEPQKVIFEKSSNSIFNELNEYLIELIDRIRADYHTNKQFTQNASHELQTPLAIIKGNTELLIQSPNFAEREIKSLGIILHNTNRLSKLNSALILLSKIEHHRFVDSERVNLNQVIDEMLDNFQDLIQIQNITITKDYQEVFETEMSYTLAEILITNLLQNAIRYNIEPGSIYICTTNNYLTIRNPGLPLTVSTDKLFKRFKRDANTETGLGLGLSIVKRICDQYEFDIQYTFEKDLHTLTLTLDTDPR